MEEIKATSQRNKTCWNNREKLQEQNVNSFLSVKNLKIVSRIWGKMTLRSWKLMVHLINGGAEINIYKN